ncbi:MAG: fibronectin type III domain-containing protein [Paludibacteraceae bacterium]|nr:fibronectin type III domain-containing protein [Paludibacteraceae bacterium]
MKNMLLSFLALCCVLTLSAQQMPDCQSPENLSISDLRATSVTLNWGLSPGRDVPTVYTLTIKDQNRVTVYQDNALSAPYMSCNVTSLTPNTTYTAELTGNCNASSSGYSSTATITFTTLCSVMSAPYTQDFDTLTAPPRCTYSNGASITYVGRFGKGLALHVSTSESAYFVFPELNVQSDMVECSLWIKTASIQSGNIPVQVGIVTDPADIGSSFEPLYFGELSDLNWHEIRMNTAGTMQTATPSSTIAISIPSGIETDVYIDDVLIRQIPTCIRPEDFTITNILSNSATLSWTTTNAANCRVNVTSGNSSYSVLATTNPFTLTGLTPNTEYTLSLRGICSPTDSSELSGTTITFTTKCTAASSPLFLESFDNLTVPNTIPSCWESGWKSKSPSTAVPVPFSASNTQTHTGAYAMALQNQPTGNVSYLSSRLIPVDQAGKYSLSVWVYRQNLPQYQLESLRFWASPSYNSTTGATLLGTVPLHYQSFPAEPAANIWYNYEYVIPTSGNIYILVEGISENGATVYFDDVEVKLTPSCMKVSDIHLGNPTSTDVDLLWNPGNTETQWEINYTLTQNNSIIATVTDTVSTPTVRLTGLTPATVYSVTGYIRSLCSAGQSADSVPFSQTFTTSCLPITTLPYTCGFETAELSVMANPLPLCWQRLNNANQSISYYPNVAGSAEYAHTGSGTLRFYPYHSVLYNYGDYQLAILPEIDASYPINNLRITFYARMQEITSSHNFIVGVITNPTDINTFVPVDSFPVSSNFHRRHEVLFDSYTGTTGRIALLARASESTEPIIYVDDVVVDVIPSCRDLVGNGVTISDITDVAARITVTDTTATSWQYVYGPQGFDPTTAQPLSSSSATLMLTGLTPSTTYSVHARRVCGSEYGNWCDAVSFTTTCAAAALPFSDDFESYNVGPLHGCFTIQTVYNVDSFNVFSSVPGSSINQTFNHTPRGGKGLSSSNGSVHYAVTGSMTALAYVHLEADHNYQISLYAKKYDDSHYDYSYDLTFNLGTLVSYLTPIGMHTVTGNFFQRYASTFTVPATGNYYVGFTTTLGRGNVKYYPYIDDVLIEEVACTPPTSTIISDLTSSSALLNINSTATSWQVAVSSFPIDIEKEIVADIMSDTVTSPMVNITGLRANADYYYTVRSICANGEASNWMAPSSFHTYCVTETIPYNENFEKNGATNCWNMIGTTGSVTRAADQQRSGRASMLVNSASILSPQFNVISLAPYMLSMWAYAPRANTTISVGVVIDPDDPGAAEIVSTYTITAANSWTEINIPFDIIADPEYADFYNARYVFLSVPNGSSVYFDDLSIDVPPTCARPSNGTITSVTANSAVVDWTESGNATQWRIRCVPASGPETTLDVNTHPYTITGLNPSTFYNVYLSALCSTTDHSPEYSAGQFVTSCGVITAPWSEDFELHTVGHTPACWDTLGSTAPGIEERLWGVYESSVGKSIRLWNWGVMQGDALINSPEIAIPATGSYELVYDYSHQASSGPLNVKIRRRGARTYTLLASHANTGESTSEDYTPIAYHNNTIPLTAYAGDTVRIQFMNVTDWVSGAIFVDNVRIRAINPCTTPSVDIRALTDVSARFQISDSVHTSWQYAYGPEDFDPSTVQLTSTSSYGISLTGLTPFTFYDLCVRSVCGSGSYSEWVRFSFQTTLTPTAIPYSTDFSNPEDNDLWIREGDAVNYFVFGNDPAALINSTHALYVTSDGLHYNYDVSVNSMSCITRLFSFENGLYDIEFDWQCTGGKYVLNGVADYGRFYLMPAYADVLPQGQGMYYNYYFWDDDIIPLDGNTHIELKAGLNHTSAIVDMTGRAGAYQLVFFWFTEQDGGASHYPLSVANLSLSEVSCNPLANLAVPHETITETSIDVHCSKRETSAPLRWVVSTSALIADSVLSGTSQAANFTINGLLPSSQYYLFVRSECSATEVSPWIDVPFRTLCGPVTNYPVTEDFEDSSFPPYCWSAAGWSRYNNRPYTYAHGNGCAHAGYGTNAPLVSPELSFEADRQYYVSFWLLRSSNVNYTDRMDVYVSPSSSITDGTLLQSFTTYDPNVNIDELAFYTIDVPEEMSGIYHIIFAATADGGNQTTYLDDVTYGIYPRCRDIETAPALVSRTATTVTLSAENHGYTKLQFGVAPYSTNVTSGDIATIVDTSYITGLTPNTAYAIYARGICTFSDDTTAWSPAVIVTTRVDDCYAPDGLSFVTQTSDTMAAIQWNAVPDATYYQVVLNSAATSDTFTTTETSIVLSPLTANTAYTFTVRGNCVSQQYTAWSTLTFTTLQTPATMPYHTGFEPTDDNALWRTVSSAYSNFAIGTDGGGRHTGAQGLYVSADGSTYSQACPTGPGGEHIYGVAYITRTLYFDEAGNYEVGFDWKCDPISDNTYGYYDAYGRAYIAPVGVVLPADASTYYSAYPSGSIELASQMTGSQTWQRSSFVVDVPEAGYRDIVFQWYSFSKYGDAQDYDLSDYPLAIDNLDISYLHCLAVNNVKVHSYSDTCATFVIERSVPVGLEYAIETVDVEDSIQTVFTANSDTITVNGLTPETNYHFFVRQVCDPVYSSSWRRVSFRTTNAPAVLPYVCDFEDDDENSRWLFFQNQQNQLVIGTNANGDGTKALYVSSDGFTNTYNNTAKSYAFATRTFYLPAGDYYVSYDWRNAGESNHDYTRMFFYPADIELPVGTFLFGLGPSDLPYSAIAADGGSQLVDDPVMSNMENRVTITAEGSYNLVVAWQNDHIDGDNPPFVLDNVAVHQTSCNPPTVSVVSELQEEGLSSAIISLRQGQNDMVYAVSTTKDFSGAISIDTVRNFSGRDTFLLTGTSPSTSYYLISRSLCSADDYSVRSVTPFITPCGLITSFPYHEGFESVSTTYIPGMATSICWTPFGASTASSGNPRYQATTTSQNVHEGSRALQLTAHRTNAMTLTLPEMADISTLRLSFDVRYSDAKNAPTLTAGYMTDPDDESTFVAVLATTASTTYTNYTVNMTGAPAGSRFAFRFMGGNTNGKTAFLDNVNVFHVVDGDSYSDTICYTEDYVAHRFSIPADSIPVGVSTHYLTVPGSSLAVPDTIYTLTLLKRAEAISTFHDTICGGNAYVSGIWNIPNPVTRRYHQVYPGASVYGCDSTVELFLEVIPVSHIIRDTICHGGSYVFGGQTLTTPGLYTRTYQTTHGCTAVDTLYLTVVDDSVFSTQQICYNNLPYRWNGGDYYTSGRHVTTITGPHGCQQTAVLDLTVYSADTTLYVSLCEGGMVLVIDTTITEAGNYTLHRINPIGCDVNYHIVVTKTAIVPEEIYDVACEGKPYTRYGITSLTVTQDTVVTITTRTRDNMCDSVANIHLTYHPTQYSDTTAYLGPDGTFTWHDQTYTVTGDYRVTLSDINGCDSVVTLHLALGVDEVSDITITVVPNPVSAGSTAFVYGEFGEVEKVEILSNFGQIVETFVPDTYPIEVSGISASGLYYVRVTTKSGSVHLQKLIVK